MAKKAFLIGANTLGLSFANNDVMLLNEALQKHGYEITIPSLSKSDILTKFDSFIDDCKKNDTIVFYFSGHGFIPKGTLHLVIGEDLTKTINQISIDNITSPIEECKAENKLIILDCCKANSISDNWRPKQSERYRVLTASEKLEKGKELDFLKASFLTYFIAKAVNESSHVFPLLSQLTIEKLYRYIHEQAKILNSSDINTQVPIPNLLGNSKVDFPIIEIQTVSSNKANTSNNKKKYLRKRCRLFYSSSELFHSLMGQLLSNNYSEEVLDYVGNQILEFKNIYEHQMLLAAYHERKGKVENVLKVLSEYKFRGDEESSRLLYRALIYEKMGEIDKAIEDLHKLLTIVQDINFLRAAQFNLTICYEKLEQYDLVDFSRFIQYQDIVFSENERLSDKAVNMHLIYCDKTNEEFLFNKELKKTLDYEAENNPVGYTKTLINFMQLTNKRLNEDDLNKFFNLRHNMSIDTRAGVVYKLIELLDEKDASLRKILISELNEIYQINKAKHIKNLIDSIPNNT